MATHSSILAEKSHGQRSLVGYSSWVRKESDTTEWRTLSREGEVLMCLYRWWWKEIKCNEGHDWNVKREFIINLYWWRNCKPLDFREYIYISLYSPPHLATLRYIVSTQKEERKMEDIVLGNGCSEQDKRSPKSLSHSPQARIHGHLPMANENLAVTIGRSSRAVLWQWSKNLWTRAPETWAVSCTHFFSMLTLTCTWMLSHDSGSSHSWNLGYRVWDVCNNQNFK